MEGGVRGWEHERVPGDILASGPEREGGEEYDPVAVVHCSGGHVQVLADQPAEGRHQTRQPTVPLRN